MYIGYIGACDAFGKPLSASCTVSGHGCFSEIAQGIASFCADHLAKSAVVSETAFRASTDQHGKSYFQTKQPSLNDVVHESFHAALREQYLDATRCENSSAYCWALALEESGAAAYEHATVLEELKKSNDGALIERQCTAMTDLGAFGTVATELCARVLESPETAQLEKITALANASPIEHKRKSWASLLNDLKYTALYYPCLNILERQGLGHGKDCIIDAFVALIEAQNPAPCAKKLLEAGARTLPKLPIFSEKLATKAMLVYARDNQSKLELDLAGPEKLNCPALCELKNAVKERFIQELEQLGELIIDVYASKISFKF